MEEIYSKKLFAALIFIVLLIASFFVLKPILLSMALGFILAFIFSPIYRFIHKITKMPNLSASIICVFLLLLLVLPIWLFTPALIKESFKIYETVQKVDFVGILKSVFPSIFSSDQFSQEVGGILHSFVVNTINSLLNSLASAILDFPTLALQAVVVVFTMFFVLRDGGALAYYLESLLPFSDEIKKKLFKSSKEITASILYGTVVIGVLEGIILGIAFFLFGVSNAFLLTLLAIIAGVLPIIGPMAIWLPVIVFLIIKGDNVAVIGILIFGLISSNIDHILRPLFVSRRTQIHSAVVLIGMIGGLFLFGVLGLLLGPLILAYLTIVLEIYRDKNPPKID